MSIKLQNIDVWGFEHAIRGMRNPKNSWEKSDSYSEHEKEGGFCSGGKYFLGKNDLSLMRRLYKGGSEHRKYLRQIFVSMDITAPLYWWKEFDTYKVGTVANSCSTMHKIADKEFTLSDFSHEHLDDYEHNGGLCRDFLGTLEDLVDNLNVARQLYLSKNDKKWWWQMIQLLPTSYNQRRTVTLNYENVVTIIKQRTGHKLDEWNTFVEELKKLPHVKEIME